jgi:hypothetical protein
MTTFTTEDRLNAKTMSQRETEAFLAMAKRLEELEALVPQLKKRIADLEDLLRHS